MLPIFGRHSIGILEYWSIGDMALELYIRLRGNTNALIIKFERFCSHNLDRKIVE